MPDEVADRRHAATLAYENAGREISQAFDTLNSNLTLAAGTLGALITVLGAGQLFGPSILVETGKAVTHATTAAPSSVSGIPQLSNISLLLLAAAFPLLVRFFIRATIGYQNLLRFNEVQRGVWDYLSGEAEWDLARLTMRLYVQQWRSPQTKRKLFEGSFKYGFGWVFMVSIVALAWGFVTAPGIVPRCVAGAFISISLMWEMVTLRKARYFKTLSAAENRHLARLRGAQRSTAVRPAQTRPLLGWLLLMWLLRRSQPAKVDQMGPPSNSSPRRS